MTPRKQRVELAAAATDDSDKSLASSINSDKVMLGVEDMRQTDNDKPQLIISKEIYDVSLGQSAAKPYDQQERVDVKQTLANEGIELILGESIEFIDEDNQIAPFVEKQQSELKQLEPVPPNAISAELGWSSSSDDDEDDVIDDRDYKTIEGNIIHCQFDQFCFQNLDEYGHIDTLIMVALHFGWHEERMKNWFEQQDELKFRLGLEYNHHKVQDAVDID